MWPQKQALVPTPMLKKFIDIKCMKAGLKPAAVILVVTVRAMKFHGGVDKEDLNQENLIALEKSVKNFARHQKNIQQHYVLHSKYQPFYSGYEC